MEKPWNEEGKTNEKSKKTLMKKVMIQEVTILPFSKRLIKQAFKQRGKEPQNDRKSLQWECSKICIRKKVDLPNDIKGNSTERILA